MRQVVPDDRRRVCTAIAHIGGADARGPCDDMVVGEHLARGGEHHPGPGGLPLAIIERRVDVHQSRVDTRCDRRPGCGRTRRRGCDQSAVRRTLTGPEDASHTNAHDDGDREEHHHHGPDTCPSLRGDGRRPRRRPRRPVLALGHDTSSEDRMGRRTSVGLRSSRCALCKKSMRRRYEPIKCRAGRARAPSRPPPNDDDSLTTPGEPTQRSYARIVQSPSSGLPAGRGSRSSRTPRREGERVAVGRRVVARHGGARRGRRRLRLQRPDASSATLSAPGSAGSCPGATASASTRSPARFPMIADATYRLTVDRPRRHAEDVHPRRPEGDAEDLSW